jgi:hypothetical protein
LFKRLAKPALEPINSLQRDVCAAPSFQVICFNRRHTVAYDFGVTRMWSAMERQAVHESGLLGAWQSYSVGIKIMWSKAELAQSSKEVIEAA